MSWLITGAGAVASVGAGVEDVFSALCAGRSGLGELRGFDHGRFRARHAYEIDDRPEAGRDVPGRATRWLLAAVAEAVRDAGLDDGRTGADLADIPVLVGTGLRELRSAELWWRDGTAFEARDLHFGAALRERFGAADTHVFSNACAASLYALALGSDLLAAETADTVVVAGVDSITESMYGLVDRISYEQPEALRPFERGRKGVVMGEAAVAVVLRREDGPPPPAVRGRLRSVAVNCDARHVTAPDPEGIAAAIHDAHRRAGVKPRDVDLVLLHGTGTLLNDEAEATALTNVFGDAAGRPLMTAIKSMTGHTSGASGLLGLVVALEALRSGRVPPTGGLVDPIDEASAFQLVCDEVVGAELTVAQIEAFGFGGVNAVAIVERVAP